jgi:Phosphodiester glycosidase
MVLSGVSARSASVVLGLVVVLACAGAVAAHGGQVPPFRPPSIKPVVSPSLRGEGVWHAAGPPIRGGPAVLISTFRPDAANRSVVAYVAWVDHTRTQLSLYPGASQPPVAVPRGPAEIPLGQRWRLLATFNGGFKYGSGSGGGGGFSVNGHTYVPLERDLGTLVGYRDGRVDVNAWRGGPTPGPKIAFARQDLHLLVHDGHPGPDLGSQAVWGWVFGGGSTTWRTGVGIDRHGNLIYAAVDDTTAALAAILIRVGAVRAIELDMNPLWPTFNTYAHRHGLHPSQFVPNYQEPLSRYLAPDSRDFFAVYRRVDGPAWVPFR